MTIVSGLVYNIYMSIKLANEVDNEDVLAYVLEEVREGFGDHRGPGLAAIFPLQPAPDLDHSLGGNDVSTGQIAA